MNICTYFIRDYLLGNSYFLPQDELYHEVYPVWTYSYLGFLVLVFLFTDLTRCPGKDKKY